MVIQAVVDEGDGKLAKPVSRYLAVESTQKKKKKNPCIFFFLDCLGHAHVLLAAFERVRIEKNKMKWFHFY